MKESVRVFAPATVSNLACAFDILGLALDQPGDIVEVRPRDLPGVTISSIRGDGGRLPLQVDRNTAGVGVLALLRHLDSETGLEIVLEKGMPLGSGLGSSAASAVAALVAANLVLGEPLSRYELLPFALEAERAACGAAHADNAAPSLLGGIVLIRSYQPLDIVSLPVPADLWCALVHPHIEIRTEEARRLLASHVPFSDAVIQWGNVAGLVAGLTTSDYSLIGRSLQDVIVEPQRSSLVPGFAKVKEAALAKGALGASLSGSGPSIFALASDKETALQAAGAMRTVFRNEGIDSEPYVSKVNQAGPRILEEDPSLR